MRYIGVAYVECRLIEAGRARESARIARESVGFGWDSKEVTVEFGVAVDIRKRRYGIYPGRQVGEMKSGPVSARNRLGCSCLLLE